MGLVQLRSDNFNWELKYRPRTVDELILPDSIKNMVREIISGGEIPNLLLYGTPGLGKTSTVCVIIDELKVSSNDYLFINGSSENTIDVLRNKITAFASSVSFDKRKKVVIIDEADNLGSGTNTAVQKGFRSFIEEFSSNCSFIFTANYPNKILGALRSRFKKIEFKFTDEDEQFMLENISKRVIEILDMEKVKYDNPASIKGFVENYFPDFRSILCELQKVSMIKNKHIDFDYLIRHIDSTMISKKFFELFATLTPNTFKSMADFMEYVAIEPQTFYSMLYDSAFEYIPDEQIPMFYFILNKYSVESANILFPKVNLMGFVAECMGKSIRVEKKDKIAEAMTRN